MPETPSATRTIEHELRVEARPETVFAYFTDPARMTDWFGTEATIDPQPGGIFHVRFVRDIGEISARGVFVEVIPYSRVVFTWGWERGVFGVQPASTRVEVTLVRDEVGTVVRLVHSELPDEAVEVHEAGWSHYLERLGVVVAGGDPGPDDLIPPGVVPPPEAAE